MWKFWKISNVVSNASHIGVGARFFQSYMHATRLAAMYNLHLESITFSVIVKLTENHLLKLIELIRNVYKIYFT